MKYKIRNCSDQYMSLNSCLSKKFLASPLIAMRLLTYLHVKEDWFCLEITLVGATRPAEDRNHEATLYRCWPVSARGPIFVARH